MATKRVADMTPEEHERLKERRKTWKKKKYIKVSELSEEEREKRRSNNKKYYQKKKEKMLEMSEEDLMKIKKKKREWYARWKEENKEHLYQYRKQYYASKGRRTSLKGKRSKLLTRLKNPIKRLISTLNKILTKRKATIRAKELYWENPEKFREKRRKWINNNREKKRLSDKKYNAKRWKNEEYRVESRKRDKLYRQKHRLEISEKRKLDRQLHPEKYREQHRRYREKHTDKERQEQKRIQRELSKKGFIKYETFAHRLSIDEDPIKDENGCLMVRDFHTKEYFYPRRQDVYNRIMALEGKVSGENHLYASKESKASCPVYHARKQPRFTVTYYQNLARDPVWRGMVISRANGHCERCGKKSDKLIAHHKIPVKACEMFSADMDNGMALCPECHKEVHSTDGCRLHELAAEKREAV